MKKTVPERSSDDDPHRLPPTERGHGTSPAGLAPPASGSNTETLDVPKPQETEPDTNHGGIPSLPLGATRSSEPAAPEPDTEAGTAGRTTDHATLDSPSSGRGDGLSFLVNSELVNSQTTLPPGAEEPESKVPRVAGYQILGVLGEGGMGIVYKAKHARLDRFVALKMIRAGAGARPQDLARFEAEAKAVAAECPTARSSSCPEVPFPGRSAANRCRRARPRESPSFWRVRSPWRTRPGSFTET
jgi:hypothetical protein